ncbi:MAG: hypothetical protein WDO68_24390 [Gammaproteobacteria bacterium]
MRTKRTAERSGRDVDPGDAKRDRPRDQTRSGGVIVGPDGRVEELVREKEEEERESEIWLTVSGGRFVVVER